MAEWQTQGGGLVLKIYGPYTRKDGRKHIVIVNDDGSRTTQSYPRFLKEQELGRKLKIWEDVDHTDRDKSNDDLANLLPRFHAHRVALDVKRVRLVEITCVLCGNIAYKKPNDLDNNAKQGKDGPFCSKSCAGKYSAELQNGRLVRTKQERLPAPREYYYLDK